MYDLYYSELEKINQLLLDSINGQVKNNFINIHVQKVYVAQESYIASLYLNKKTDKIDELDRFRKNLDRIINRDLSKLDKNELMKTQKELEELLKRLKEFEDKKE